MIHVRKLKRNKYVLQSAVYLGGGFEAIRRYVKNITDDVPVVVEGLSAGRHLELLYCQDGLMKCKLLRRQPVTLFVYLCRLLRFYSYRSSLAYLPVFTSAAGS